MMLRLHRLGPALLLGVGLLQVANSCGDGDRTSHRGNAGILEPATAGAAGAREPSAGAAGMPLMAAGGASPAAVTVLGLPCQAPSDCGDLRCLTAEDSTLDSGSPPGGLCTLACDTPSATADCSALGGHCLSFAQGVYCLQVCRFGPAPNGQVKCQERSDFACEPIYRRVAVACDVDSDCGADAVCRSGSCTLVTPLCLPRCNHDGDCPDDRHCHPVSGECVTTPPQGLSLGAPCDLAGADPCRGICLRSPGEELGRCSEFCTLGVKPACGADADCTLTLNGAPTAASGDQGLCAPSCDCDTPCEFGLECLPLPSSRAASGYCGSPMPNAPDLDALTCGTAGGAGSPG